MRRPGVTYTEKQCEVCGNPFTVTPCKANGTGLGGHVCSSEFYMPGDLGVLDGSRPDRHEGFRKHYPDGYRMDFVTATDVLSHPGLEAAYQKNQEKRLAASEALSQKDSQ